MKDFKTTTSAYLWLAIFLFSLLGTGQNAKAQFSDTVWTRMTQATIKQVAFHPNSQLIATGNNSAYVSIWDVPTGVELNRFSGASSNLAVEFTENGKYLAFGGGSDQGGVKIIDCDNWKDYRMLVCPTNSAAFINDTNLIVIGGRKDIRVWDFQKNEVVKYIDSIVKPDFAGSLYELEKIIYSPINNSLIYTASDGCLRFYNLTTNKIDFTLNNPSYGDLTLSPNKKYLAFQNGSDEKALQIMDVDTKQIIQTFPGHYTSINNFVFSPDGKYLAVAYEYIKVLKIWEIQTGQNVYSYVENPARYFNAIDWSKDNKFIAGGTPSQMFLYNNKFVGISEGEKNFDTLYPNPTNQSLTIQFNLPKPENTEIDLVELEGKKLRNLFSGFLDSGKHKILAETTGIASGNYFIVIHSDTFSKTFKLIIEK